MGSKSLNIRTNKPFSGGMMYMTNRDRLKFNNQWPPTPSTRLWTPADTTTINWFDADDASTITDGGGLVGIWADKSGGGHDLTATAKPQTGITSINGLNTLYFDGSDFMSNASFPIPTSGNLAIYTYAKIDLIDDNIDSLFSMDGTSNDFQFEADNVNNFVGRINVSDMGDDVQLTGGIQNGPSLFNINFDFTNGYYNAFIDGVQYAANTPYTSKLNASLSFKLFTNRGSARNVQGECGEVIINEDCSETCRQTIEGYELHRFGTQANLPAGHPHKVNAPTVEI